MGTGFEPGITSRIWPHVRLSGEGLRLLVEQVRFGSERGLSRPCSGLLWSCDVTDAGPWVGPLVAYGDCRSAVRGVPLPPALADGLDVRGQPG